MKLFIKNRKISFLFIFVFLWMTSIFSQPVITISKVVNNQAVTTGNTIGFSSGASVASTLLFNIRNTGTSNLSLNGSPIIQLTGSSDFSSSVPGTGELAPNQSTSFEITYSPTSSAVKTAQISIPNNAGAAFVINLKGAGFNFYGPKNPPAGTISSDAIGNLGRAGGLNLLITNVSLPLRTSTWWGPAINSQGQLQLKISLDGGTYTPDEILSWSSAESNFSQGRSVWRGKTLIANAINGTLNQVYIKATLLTKNQSNVIIPLEDPQLYGLSEQVGGLVKFNGLSDYLVANYLVEASTDNINFQPYLTFYDNYPTPPGLPPGGGGPAYSSVENGFYWLNTAPRLTANNVLSLNEGTSAVLTTAFLNAGDDEDLPASPQNIVFSFETTGPGNDPLVFHNGGLFLNNVLLTRSNTFTLKNIQDGLLTYQHNGSETTFDQFQFSFKDSKGALGLDGPNSIYSFNIQVIPVNDAPVAYDSSFNFSYSGISSAQLRGTDAEGTAFSFSVLSSPNLGSLNLNSATGAFTYTVSLGSFPATDVFTYRVNDGNSFSNTATVTLNLINLPPSTTNQNESTKEDQLLSSSITATDPENAGSISINVITASTKGSVVMQPGGSFTYQPFPSKFGPDYFTFKASDVSGNLSEEDTVFIRIIPRLDPGDILIADQNRLRIFDPVQVQDTIIAKNLGLNSAQNMAYKNGTSIFMLDATNGLIKIDPYTGAQSPLVARSSFSPNPGPLGILIDNQGKIIIADGSNGIVQVDTITNTLSPLFSGGSLSFSTGVLYLSNGDLLVTDASAFVGGTSKIVRITPAGVQSVVSVGNNIKVPVDLALVDADHIVVSNAGSVIGSTDNLLKINLSTGVQTILSTGGSLSFPAGLDYYQGKIYVVNSQGTHRLLQVDVNSGSQTILPGSVLGAPFGLMVVPEYILPTPVASVTSQPTCSIATGTIIVSAPIEPGATYSIGGAYQSSTTFNNVLSGTYQVTVKNSSGFISEPLSITVNAQPVVPSPPIVNGATNVCNFVGTGTVVEFSVTPDAAATSYNWSVPVNVSLLSGQGTGIIQTTINNGFINTPNKQIRVTASSVCGTSSFTIFYLLAQLPNTPQPITASATNVCEILNTANSITYSISKVTAATSYLWTAQSGTTTITHPNGPGVNDTTVQVTFSTGFTGSSITVRAVNDCGTSNARSLLISRSNPSTPGLISGPINVCANIAPGGVAASYSIAAVDKATSYTWNFPPGSLSITGQGTTSVSFIYPPGFTSGSVSVTATNGCGTSSTRLLAVTRLNPSTPGVIDVIQQQACSNRIYSYTIAVMPANASSVQWTVPVSSGAQIISGQGTNSIFVSYPSTAINGLVTVTALNNCGISVTRQSIVKLPACAPDFSKKTAVETPVKAIAGEINLAVNVFPNPSVNEFSITISSVSREKITIKLYNLQGSILKEFKVNANEATTVGNELVAGTYLLEIIQGSNRSIKKLVKF